MVSSAILSDQSHDFSFSLCARRCLATKPRDSLVLFLRSRVEQAIINKLVRSRCELLTKNRNDQGKVSVISMLHKQSFHCACETLNIFLVLCAHSQDPPLGVSRRVEMSVKKTYKKEYILPLSLYSSSIMWVAC